MAAILLAQDAAVASAKSSNDFFTGGLMLMFVGVCLAWLKTILTYVWNKVTHRFLVSIVVESDDEGYTWLLQWLSAYEAQSNSRSLQIFSRRDEKKRRHETIAAVPSVHYMPARGPTFIQYKGKWVWIHRDVRRVGNNLLSESSSTKPMEYISLTAYGRSVEPLKEIIKESRQLAMQGDNGKTLLFTPVYGRRGGWKRSQAKPARPWESVQLPGRTSDEILSDAQSFLDSRTFFESHGVPYRRGYLLYGPPGCGKTSFIAAVAGKLRLNIAILSLSNRMLDDDVLMVLLAELPQNTVLLIEDVDAAFCGRESGEDRKGGNTNSVTFSGLLNALDGIASSEGRILFLTTNHIEKLDPALMRPGRVDRKVLFDVATRDQIASMFTYFYRERVVQRKDIANVDDLAQQFCESLPYHNVPMANVQGHFLRYLDSPEDAIANAQVLLDEYERDVALRKKFQEAAELAAREKLEKDREKKEKYL